MKKPFKLKGILIGYLQNVIAGNNLYTILVPNPPKNYTNQHCKSVKLMPYRLCWQNEFLNSRCGEMVLSFFSFSIFFRKIYKWNITTKLFYKEFLQNIYIFTINYFSVSKSLCRFNTLCCTSILAGWQFSDMHKKTPQGIKMKT